LLVEAVVYVVGSLYTRAVAGSNPAAPTLTSENVFDGRSLTPHP